MQDKLLTNKYQYEDLLIRSQDRYAQAKHKFILDRLKDQNINTVLDVGCGSGELSIMLAQNGYYVEGVDIENDYIALANRNSKKLRVKNCNFIVSSIEKYKSQTKYDALVSVDVLEHIKDDKYAFEKMSSFIKPGGSAIITIPAGQYLSGLHDEQLGHFRRYSKGSFKKIIPNSLRIVQMRYFGFFFIPVSFLMSRLLRKSYPVVQSGDKQKNPLISTILNIILNFEQLCPFPLGTSLLFWGIKENK